MQQIKISAKIKRLRDSETFLSGIMSWCSWWIIGGPGFFPSLLLMHRKLENLSSRPRDILDFTLTITHEVAENAQATCSRQ
jgi:hypothetical protein